MRDKSALQNAVRKNLVLPNNFWKCWVNGSCRVCLPHELIERWVKMAALFRKHQSAFHTQYAEVRERARAAGRLLPGSPGALALRAGTGHSYWYRVYYFPPGKQRENLVGKAGDDAALQAMRERIEFSEWVSEQVPTLRKLGFQVGDKLTARV